MAKKPQRKTEKGGMHPSGCSCLRCFEIRTINTFEELCDTSNEHDDKIELLKGETERQQRDIIELKKRLDKLEKGSCKCHSSKT